MLDNSIEQDVQNPGKQDLNNHNLYSSFDPNPIYFRPIKTSFGF